jgi:anti-sigma B factor antagonist
MQDDRDLVLADFSDATTIDSTTLSVLLNAHRRLTRRGGALALVVTDGAINRVLEVTLLNRTFDVHDSRETALATLEEAASREPDRDASG